MNNHLPVDIIESMPLGVMATDLNGSITMMNKQAKSFMDLSDDAGDAINIRGSILNDIVLRARDVVERGPFTVKKNGKIFETSITPLSNTDGQSTGTLIMIKDITKAETHRELELKKEKYAALEAFSADVAHEIRNPLGSIELYASLLKKELKRKKDIHRVNQIIAAAKIVENKIKSLILLSKRFDIPTQSVNIHSLLKDILLFSEQIIEDETIFLSVQYAEIEPLVECNPDMIKQVFLNLILNALQTMPEECRLDIVTRYHQEDQSIEICFIDNGAYPPDHIPSRIFERFSRINENNSYLGLAVVHNIINLYKGSLKIEFTEGTGTAFVFSFPLTNPPPPVETPSGMKI
ncbi:MAG: hypothetical protein JXA41_01270 [Deltaproteobacteria bacterium]|nr:hypothetical protein [Deltaproteobacteria bacterium]